jgi:hypothetical protein
LNIWTLLDVAFLIASFLWEHRVGIVVLLALGCLVLIVNSLAGLEAMLHEQLDDLNKTLKSIASSLGRRDDDNRRT